MAFLLAHFELDDYDTWKRERFDADPAGRKQAAKGHQIFRAVDEPNKVFVGVEFDSVEEAEVFPRAPARLRSLGCHNRGNAPDGRRGGRPS